MHTAVFDESGNHDDSSKVFAVSGYITTDENWKVFEDAWRAVLQRFGIPSFHMSTFENRRGIFEGWENGRRIELICALIDVINDHLIMGVGCGLSVQDYKQLFPPALQDGFTGAYMMCFISCYNVIIQTAREFNITGDINVFLEQNEQLTPFLVRTFDDIDVEISEVFPFTGDIKHGDKASDVRFQAADILAYETYKHLLNEKFDGGRPPRKSLERLKKDYYQVHYMGRPALKSLLRDLIIPSFPSLQGYQIPE